MNIILVLQLAKDGFDIHNWPRHIDMHNVVHFRFSKKATHYLPVGFKVYVAYFKSYGMVKCLWPSQKNWTLKYRLNKLGPFDFVIILKLEAKSYNAMAIARLQNDILG
jgi:hypothetical protein